ncbi:MAG: tetratricopeptide repeat-containing diguanylate cyclase, partial [Deefgea sp.]
MLSREAFGQEIARLEHIIHFGQSEQAITPLKSLARQHRREPSLACQADYLLAYAEWSGNNFSDAKRHIERCFKVNASNNPVYFKAKILSVDIMNSIGNLAGALKICLDLLHQSDPNHQPKNFALAYLGISDFYLLNHETGRALVCQRYAYSFAKQSNDINTILKTALHLLQSLTNKKDYPESLDIISFCWSIIKDGFTDPAWIAELHHYTGLCFIGIGDLDHAAESLNQSLTIHTRENLLWGQTQNRMALAGLYVKNGDLKQACSMLESTILLASSFDQGYLQKKICIQLRDIRIEQGDFAAALAAQETYHRIESQYQSKISKNMTNLSQTQLNELDKKQEIIILKLENKSLKKELIQLQEQLNFKKNGIDPITQLPDRRAFISYQPTEEHQPIWGYLLSIDNLFEINETLGYEVGDTILLQCSELLQSTLSILSEHVLTWFRYSGQQ